MSEQIDTHRRRIFGALAMTLAAAQVGLSDTAWGTPNTSPILRKQDREALGPIRQINAGVLNVGFADLGKPQAPAVILLHGWPYDIHAFHPAAPRLAAQGYRVIVPYLRGHGTTRFLATATARHAQQAILAVDVIDLMNALKLDKAILAGFDWGARTANIVAALWPQRCKAMVSVGGYLIASCDANRTPLVPKAQLPGWFAFHLATARGRAAYATNRRGLARLIWQSASPQWHFDEPTFARSATALDNPDHLAIVNHHYRWRLGVAEGDPTLDAMERRSAAGPSIAVPSITLEGNACGALHSPTSNYASKFSGPYAHHLVGGGIGRNLPQEAPDAFVAAILQVDGFG